MISENDARAKILEAVRPLPPRKMSILSASRTDSSRGEEALDHFAAEDYFARLPLPMFDNSAMDGYAVIASDCKKDARLRVISEQPAGVDRKLRVSNGKTVRFQSLLKRTGAVAASAENCNDDSDSLRAAMQRAAENEILIVSGGVSVGEHDLVQKTLRDLGATIDIWRVAIKPGKTFLFGQLGRCFVFGLPGNPVSAFVTFLQFVRPAILKMMGATDVDLPKMTAQLAADVKNESERAHYVRGKFENGKFTPIGRQESHALFGLSQSNALLRVESGKELKASAAVEIEIF